MSSQGTVWPSDPCHSLPSPDDSIYIGHQWKTIIIVAFGNTRLEEEYIILGILHKHSTKIKNVVSHIGAAILRMVSHILTPTIFQNALQNYLTAQ